MCNFVQECGDAFSYAAVPDDCASEETPMGNLRLCDAKDRNEMATIINRAAERYRGTIPADRWQEP